MTRHDDRKATIRDRMGATGEPYTVARRAIDDPSTPVPCATDVGVPVEEQGVRALPADATLAQRAHAEAVWRPTEDPDALCCCSGMCQHGQAPEHSSEDGAPCPGRLLHTDRYPGSMLGLTSWHDEYVCDTCGQRAEHDIELPEIPWGEHTGTGTLVYEGVRHPNFRQIPEDTPRMPAGDGSCRACGGYAFEGLLCEGCRRDGWNDAYGSLEEPENDQDEDAWD